jgi:hypothetical protein
MGKIVTINLDENIEKEFKEKARLKYRKRKGSLAKAMNEALEEWLKNNNNDVLKENSELLGKGIRMKKWKFNREDLYER